MRLNYFILVKCAKSRRKCPLSFPHVDAHDYSSLLLLIYLLFDATVISNIIAIIIILLSKSISTSIKTVAINHENNAKYIQAFDSEASSVPYIFAITLRR